jgi:putative peptidoglycan lipid II flippase
MTRRIGIAAAIWAGGILLSRVIGLFREAAFGRIVGGGQAADVYQAAFTIPNFLNYLLAAGALSIVFIPLFAGHLARGDEERGWRAFSVIATTVGLVLLVATGLGWLAVPWVDRWLYAGFPPEALAELDAMTRVLIPAQIFHVLGGLLSAALQARDRHALPAMASVVYNAAIIVGGLVAGPEHGAWGFVWGVLVGSALGPFGLPLLGCLRMGLRYRPILRWDEDLRTYLIQTLPIMLAFSIVVVDDWLLMSNAANLDEGSVATLMYAKNLLRVPIGVFGLALGAAAFPTLARLVAEGKPDEAYRTLTEATRRMLVLALGAQVVLTTAGPEIAAVIYGERLLPGQHAAIGVALGLMALALWAWAGQTVLARGFYALGQNWVPSVLGTVVVAVVWPLYAGLAAVAGTAGLAAASSVGIGLYVLLLGFFLRRAYGGASGGFVAFALRVAPAVAAGLGVGLGARAALWAAWPDGLVGAARGLTGIPILAEVGPAAAALAQGATFAMIAGLTYLLVARLLGVPGLAEVVALVTRRLGRRRGGA